MNTGMKIGAAVVGGYILGRRRKAKVALAFGGWLIGKKLNWDPKALASQVGKELQSSPQFGELRDQFRDEVVSVGKNTAGSLIAAQTNRLADALHQRTEGLKTAGTDDERAEANAEQSEADGEDESSSNEGAETAEAERTSATPTDEAGAPAEEETAAESAPAEEETAAEEPKRARPARPRKPASAKKPMTDVTKAGQ